MQELANLPTISEQQSFVKSDRIGDLRIGNARKLPQVQKHLSTTEQGDCRMRNSLKNAHNTINIICQNLNKLQ